MDGRKLMTTIIVNINILEVAELYFIYTIILIMIILTCIYTMALIQNFICMEASKHLFQKIVMTTYNF